MFIEMTYSYQYWAFIEWKNGDMTTESDTSSVSLIWNLLLQSSKMQGLCTGFILKSHIVLF